MVNPHMPVHSIRLTCLLDMWERIAYALPSQITRLILGRGPGAYQ